MFNHCSFRPRNRVHPSRTPSQSDRTFCQFAREWLAIRRISSAVPLVTDRPKSPPLPSGKCCLCFRGVKINLWNNTIRLTLQVKLLGPVILASWFLPVIFLMCSKCLGRENKCWWIFGSVLGAQGVGNLCFFFSSGFSYSFTPKHSDRSNYRIPRTFWNTPRKRGIRGYAAEFDHPSPEFLECVGEWIRGYAAEFDHPSPEFLKCVGEWIRGYAVKFDHPSPEFLKCVGEWIHGYAVKLDYPSPGFLECVGEWICGYAVKFDHPSPEFLDFMGEWIRGYAVKFDHPSPRMFGVCGWVDMRIRSEVRPPLPPNFWSVWVSGYADTQWSSTTPPPECLECVGEWIRGYAVEFDHPSPQIFGVCGWVDTRIRSGVRPPLPPNFWD